MSKDPAFLFYPGDYLRDTQCLSEKAQVAYDRIMCEHMRSICVDITVSKKQVNFFTKRLNDDEREELMMVLTETSNGYCIEWVVLSIEKRRAYTDSRKRNRAGKTKKHMLTYDSHMENENEDEKESTIETEGANVKRNIFPFNVCFGEIWNKYPNKAGKKAALRHFKSSVKNDSDFEKIKKALEIYLKTERVEKGYIQNGSTWFNNWEDWLEYEEPNQIKEFDLEGLKADLKIIKAKRGDDEV